MHNDIACLLKYKFCPILIFSNFSLFFLQIVSLSTLIWRLSHFCDQRILYIPVYTPHLFQSVKHILYMTNSKLWYSINCFMRYLWFNFKVNTTCRYQDIDIFIIWKLTCKIQPRLLAKLKFLEIFIFCQNILLVKISISYGL